jgi:hypothetical protein
MAANGRLQPYKISEFMPPEWLLLVKADVRRFRGNIRCNILRGEVGIHRHPERLDDQYPLLGRQAALQDQATVRVEEPAQVPAVVLGSRCSRRSCDRLHRGTSCMAFSSVYRSELMF